MMSAKDFFYKNYSKSDSNAVYAENYKHLSDEDRKKLHHSVRWSNDVLIESYMRELVSVAPQEFRGRIEQFFVAKIRNFTANALALHSEDGHYGELIFFNVGLSDACFQYATLFVEVTQIFWDFRAGKNSKKDKDRVGKKLAKLSSAQDRWNSIHEVSIHNYDNILPRKKDMAKSVGIAATADKFVLYHEICHHLLGHTSNWGSSFIDALPQHCKAWARPMSDAHKREFQADAGAVLMALWAAQKNSRSAEITAALGAMLFFTTIGQFTSDAWVASESHPSEGERFTQCCNILAEVLPEDSDLGDILRDIFDFQTILYQNQSHGIGSKISGLRRANPTNSK